MKKKSRIRIHYFTKLIPGSQDQNEMDPLLIHVHILGVPVQPGCRDAGDRPPRRGQPPLRPRGRGQEPRTETTTQITATATGMATTAITATTTATSSTVST